MEQETGSEMFVFFLDILPQTAFTIFSISTYDHVSYLTLHVNPFV